MKGGSFLLETLHCFYLQCNLALRVLLLNRSFFSPLMCLNKGAGQRLTETVDARDPFPKLKLLSVASRALSTVQSYLSGFQRRKKWCLNNECFSLSCGSCVRCSVPSVDDGNKGVFSCGKKFTV